MDKENNTTVEETTPTENEKKVPFFKTALFRKILKTAITFSVGAIAGVLVGFGIGKNTVPATVEAPTLDIPEEPVADTVAE